MSHKMVKKLVVVLLILTVLAPVIANGQREGREGAESINTEHNVRESGEESREKGEHSREDGFEGADGNEMGEESGLSYRLDETYDFERKGSRLILNYDASKNIFVGTIENITNRVLDNVRIEIHLSNGIEIGPTAPVRLAPGEKRNVTLPGSQEAFVGFTPHAEVGAGEHGGSERSEGGEEGRD